MQFAPGVKMIGVAPQEPPDALVKGPLKAMEATLIEAEPLFASVTLCAALIIPTPLLLKVRMGSAVVRSRWLSMSAKIRLPEASVATALGEFRIALVAAPPSPRSPTPPCLHWSLRYGSE
jgi:hypothetical protein